MSQASPLESLGSLFKTSSGGTPLKSRKEYYEGGSIPWLLSGEVAQGEVWATTNFITPAGLQNSSAKVFPTDTVLVAMYGATAGQVGILKIEAATNQAVCGIFPSDQFVPEYLYYFLRSKKDEFVGKAVGNAQPNISQAKIRETMIPIVSHADQLRIVAILDEAFEGIATAKANAEKNLLNAQTLPAIAMRQALDTGAVSWKESTIGDQITLQRGFDITKDQQRQGAVPVVSSGGIRSYHDTFKVRAPGVVMGRKGTLGKVFYLEEDFWPHDTTLWIKDFKGNDPRFVHRFFEVLDVQGLDSGAANPALNRNLVHLLRVLWPPLDEQVALAERIGHLSASADQLALIYSAKLAALDELKKSLLHQAFTGAL